MNGFEAIAKILKLEGVEWVSCFPSNPLIEAVANEGIRLDMFRTERGAVMAADGYSRTSGREKFGVIITQGGPGAENAMGGIAQAFTDGIPILLLPGGPPLASRTVRPSFRPSDVYRPITKHCEAILNPGQLGAAMRRAFHGLRNGSGGPITIETPMDIAGGEVPDAVVSGYKPPKRSVVSPSRSDVKDAVKLFLGAKKPLIWVGGGVLFGDACDELKEFAELTDVPVFTTMQGKSAFPEDHPLSLGAGSGATTLPARTWIQECDVMLALGSSLSKTNYGQPIPAGKAIIHNTDNIDDINKDESAEVGLPGDVKATLHMLLDEVKATIGDGGRKTSVAEEIAEIRTRWMSEWAGILASDETPLSHYRVVGEIERNVDKANSIITHDAGSSRDTMIPFYRATSKGGYIGWGKTTHLGFGIPLMIGAKIAHPDKFCLNMMGDAAFGQAGLDIDSSVRAGAPITTVLLNNAGMATYPSGYESARERFGVTNMGGNYAQMAESMGATGIVVQTPDEMGPAIVEAQKLNADGTTVLIDVNAGFESRRSRF